jgi:hypothetical protein
MAGEEYKKLDINHNGSLDYGEIRAGMDKLAAYAKHPWTKEEWEWIDATGRAIDTVKPGVVDEAEFYEFANAVFEHFKLCHLVQPKKPQEPKKEEGGCVSNQMSDKVYGYLDTNKNGSLEYGEIRHGIDMLSKKIHRSFTKEEWEWIAATGKAIDTKNPGEVDKQEFHEFSNAVM